MGNNKSEKKLDVKELIERGKAKGTLSNSEIMEALEDVDYDIEQIENLYEQLGNLGKASPATWIRPSLKR